MTDTPAGAWPVIMIRDLRFRYPGSGEDVLRVPFLDIPATGMTAITGPSGAGKSTLIELLAGTLREPYEGSAYVLGAEWRSLTRDADRQRQLRRIGLIPQDYGLLTSRTPVELLGQDLADSGVAKDERPGRITAALAAVGLSPFADRQIAGLSGGQRQRVAIARMLARRVECVIADEPTANLDPALTAETMALFRHLAMWMPVVIITHDPSVAAACDRTVVLQSAVTTPARTLSPEPMQRSRRVPLPLAASIVVAVLAIIGTIAAIIIPAPGQSPSARAESHSDGSHALIRAHAVSSPRASPVSSTAPTRQDATQVIVYEPWAANGLASSIHAASTVSGYCWGQSLGSVRPDAYRCASGNSLFDPCFSSPYSSSQVACASSSPSSVTVINLTKLLPVPPAQPSSQQPSPWLIVLASGQRCSVITGSSIAVGGMRENYGCRNGSSLFGDPKRNHGIWMIFYQAKPGSSLRLAPIAKAYE